MADLDRQVLEEQLQAVLVKMAALPRHPTGYQGKVTAVDVVVVAKFRGENGEIRYADPADLTGDAPDLFLREYVNVGVRPGVNVVALLERWLPVVVPQVPGWIASIRGWLNK